MKFNPLISDFPGGWITLYRQVQDWFKDVSKPEYGLPAPIDNRITVSFELTCLIDAKYDVNDGWSFRYFTHFVSVISIRISTEHRSFSSPLEFSLKI